MKFKFNVNDMMPQLTQVASMVGQKNTMPILGCVSFSVNDVMGKYTEMTMTASDGESYLSMITNVLSTDEEIHFCVDAKDITSALKNLSGLDVEICLDEGTHTLIGSYDRGTFKLPYFDSQDYPPINSVMPIEGVVTKKCDSPQRISRALAFAKFATANDDLRPQMNGIRVDFVEGGMKTAATDGRKLVRYFDKTIEASNGDGGFTLPQKAANTLINIMAKEEERDVTICYNDTHVTFHGLSYVLTARIVEGRYPNYDAVIPIGNDKDVVVDKASLLSAIKHVVAFGNQTIGLIALHFTLGNLEIEAEDVDMSKSAHESLPCSYAGEEIRIGFNGNFLLQSIANVNCLDVRLALLDKTRPIVITPSEQEEDSEYTSILMPMVLN